jgi:DNA-binding transcriptional MerR regulator
MAHDQWLSPSELAQKLGITVKALKVYEREGLVQPHRLATGWRVYGPVQVQGLHLVMALRGMGLTLKQIKEITRAGTMDVGAVVSLQLQALQSEKQRLDGAIEKLSVAQRHLDRGHTLSLDELIALTKETQMSNTPNPNAEHFETLKARYMQILGEYLPNGEAEALVEGLRMQLDESKVDRAALQAFYKGLIEEVRPFMAAGDEDSGAVKDLARRWVAASPFTTLPGDRDRAALRTAFDAAFDGATTGPHLAAAAPLEKDGLRFISRVIRAMKSRGELD